MGEKLFTFNDLIQSLKKRWKLIAIFVVITTGVAAYLNFKVFTPTYKSSAKVFIGKDLTDAESESYEFTMYQRLIDTCAEIISSKDLVQRALDTSNIDLKPNVVLGSLVVSPKSNTQIVNLSYRSTDNELSKSVLDAIISEFINTTKDLLPSVSVSVVESPEVTDVPVSPNKSMNIAFTFAISLILAVIIVLVLELLNNNVTTKEDIEELLDITVLGSLPEYGETVMKKERILRGKIKDVVY